MAARQKNQGKNGLAKGGKEMRAAGIF